MIRLLLICLIASCTSAAAISLSPDSLRGYNGLDRAPFDAHYYRFNLRLDSATRSISGSVDMHFRLLQPADSLRLDLDERLQIDEVSASATHHYQRQGRFLMLYFNSPLSPKADLNVTVRYHGTPAVAKRPPWNGGLVWNTDSLGRPFWGVACQGEGASLWWPCKDLPIDEPDSVDLHFTLPQGLQLVSNGRLAQTLKHQDGWQTVHYQVRTPINLYNITFYAGQLQEFRLAYPPHPNDTLRFFALDYHHWGATRLLKEAATMLQRYEQLFGSFHAWKDGYKLVESPYWGMEHQSAIAYGNQFIHNNYGFDFILVHESGHEWFGNAVTAADRAHDWIQESFTTYGETLLLEIDQGIQAVLPYLESQRKRFELEQPMVGPESVYYNQHDVDIYFKGAWFLHTLRMWWDDWAPGITTAPASGKFKTWLKQIATRFKHKPVRTNDLLQLANQVSGKRNEAVWDFYLNQSALPVLQWRKSGSGDKTLLEYRWKDSVNLPLKMRISAQLTLSPDSNWKSIALKSNNITVEQILGALRHWLIEVEALENQ